MRKRKKGRKEVIEEVERFGECGRVKRCHRIVILHRKVVYKINGLPSIHRKYIRDEEDEESIVVVEEELD